MQKDLEIVLLGMPHLGHECQSHMFTEEVNLCEAYAGRLEDVISFIRVLSRTFFCSKRACYGCRIDSYALP